jgi:hypothetical protein
LKQITYSCEETLGIPPEKITEQILDISLWSGFQGYGVRPEIKNSEFKIRTPEIVGSRIPVSNTDGTSHGDAGYGVKT